MFYHIPRKMCGTGTIMDVESEHHARVIDGPGDYAVVPAAVYGIPATTHATPYNAAKVAFRLEREGYKVYIIDAKRGILYMSVDEWVFDPATPNDLPWDA